MPTIHLCHDKIMLELSPNLSLSTLTDYLIRRRWISPKETVQSLEIPGAGNMNLVLRVNTENRSLILKQARPFVQKYPQIPAPIGRIKVEYQFYHLLRSVDTIQRFLPQIYGFDHANYMLCMEDLGTAADYTSMYQRGVSLLPSELQQAVSFLVELHQLDFKDEVRDRFPTNRSLRRLNYQHLCEYPLMEQNGFDLDTVQPGLQALAMSYKTDNALKKQMRAVGRVYRSKGNTLLHGDFYPGSWLRVGETFKVIDPEFCFFGPPEYDFGILVAHCHLGRVPQDQLDQSLKAYNLPNFRPELAMQFTGMEIIRRLIGLAQLPVDLSLEEKAQLLEKARFLLQQK
jgi:5-methylthioribose kinase